MKRREKKYQVKILLLDSKYISNMTVVLLA